MTMVSHLANWKWLCYLENWDSSGINHHYVHFWSYLKRFPEKRLTDAQHFLHLVYSGFRRHFASDAIVFAGKLIFTTGLQINKDGVVCPYYAL